MGRERPLVPFLRVEEQKDKTEKVNNRKVTSPSPGKSLCYTLMCIFIHGEKEGGCECSKSEFLRLDWLQLPATDCSWLWWVDLKLSDSRMMQKQRHSVETILWIKNFSFFLGWQYPVGCALWGWTAAMSHTWATWSQPTQPSCPVRPRGSQHFITDCVLDDFVQL